MRIGINGSDKLIRPNLDEMLGDIEASEQAGFDSYWLAQTSLADALGVLALAGSRTSTITLGTAVVPTWSRHPQAVAAQALTTQAATGGRTVLGLGLAHKPSVEGNLRMKWEKPIRHMLDYLDVLQPLLETGMASHQGEVWSYMGSGGRPTEQPPKVMLAALGEQMLKIAGRRTDGTILWCVGPITLERQIVPLINAAADVAGRPAPSVVCSLPVWVTDDPGPARDFVGSILNDYASLPSYRAMLDIEGVNGVADISLIGPEDVVMAGIERVAAAGATDFTAIVMGGNPEERSRTLAVLGAAAGA
ncbi:MAG: TIGR03564 family F420-dependent LLM class oxidoreductase [Ilumatobacteraceae bacterium]